MFKRASKKFACLIGVTLSVAPIFSLAQDSNQQIKMLQEIQALRTELAELRDMVEVQQYKLNQMQGLSRVPNNTYQASPASQSIQSALSVQSTPTLQSALAVQSVPTLQLVPTTQFGIEQGNANQFPQGQTPLAQNTQTVNPNYGVPVTGSAEPQAVASYQSIPQGNNLNYGESDNVVIENRIINPNGTNPLPGSQLGATPVEERDVGQLNSYPNQQQNTGLIAVPSNQQALNNQAIPSNIQPSMTLSQNRAQSIPQQPRSATNLNPLYQAPNQNQQSSLLTQQAIQQNPQSIQQNQQTNQQNQYAISTLLSEKDYYQQGFGMLKQSKHTQAVSIFKQQINNYPQGDLSDDANYWIAESMYVNRDLDGAKQYFKIIIDNFAQSPRLPDAMLKTAYIEQEQGNKIEARILLQEIIQYHPRSNAAISAKNRLTELN